MLQTENRIEWLITEGLGEQTTPLINVYPKARYLGVASTHLTPGADLTKSLKYDAQLNNV